LAWSAALRSLIESRRGETVLGGEAVLTRLAAIGAADVPGYLRLIEAHEGTRARLETTGAVEAAPIAAG
jgi:hypothetical protein